MPRLLFEKTGNAVWMSHLDLMRLFQRAFKRAGLDLKHTQGFNPRPSVSIALPMSVGMESKCELLDFELEGQAVTCDEIREKLNAALVDGVSAHAVYDDGAKIRHLAFLDCVLTLFYGAGAADAQEKIAALFGQTSLVVEKRGKNGPTRQDIIPMIKKISVTKTDHKTLNIHARICCQNPTLNPMQLAAAIEEYLPDCKSDYVRCCRLEIYDSEEKIFR